MTGLGTARLTCPYAQARNHALVALLDSSENQAPAAGPAQPQQLLQQLRAHAEEHSVQGLDQAIGAFVHAQTALSSRACKRRTSWHERSAHTAHNAACL